jgi:hypothetical protein
MTQTALDFTAPDRPRPSDLFRAGTQCFMIYERLLQQGKITNIEIVYELRIPNSTGRISDLRDALKPHLMTVSDAKRTDDGKFEYELRG